MASNYDFFGNPIESDQADLVPAASNAYGSIGRDSIGDAAQVATTAAAGVAPQIESVTRVNESGVISGIGSYHSTNDTTPFIYGSGEPGTSVTLYVDGVKYDTVKVDGDGKWFSARFTGVSNGDHVLTVVSDSGKTGAAYDLHVDSSATSFPPDSGGPFVSLDGLHPDADSHAFLGPNFEASDPLHPQFFGTATANASITVYDLVTGQVVGTAQADANGHWQADSLVTIGAGAHEFRAELSDHSAVSGTYPISVSGSASATQSSTEAAQHVDAIQAADVAATTHVASASDVHADHAEQLADPSTHVVEATLSAADVERTPSIDHVYDHVGADIGSGNATDGFPEVVAGHGGGEPGERIFVLLKLPEGQLFQVGASTVQQDGSWTVHISPGDLPLHDISINLIAWAPSLDHESPAFPVYIQDQDTSSSSAPQVDSHADTDAAHGPSLSDVLSSSDAGLFTDQTHHVSHATLSVADVDAQIATGASTVLHAHAQVASADLIALHHQVVPQEQPHHA
ncbi:hypothetical protein [Dyella mobilis]|uniref:Bacterial Ig-like domain-containing protein n=1 Tax=Dyella mobilis TaxID=1849582 RepID=A0ABS2KDX0_9GAMM|nr:hypothetical protein [Dyella mobilis]MBM7129284.1 hypothetical protein [Dyella mobilis]GLQ98577.1 hypothetical protein GCM10007863_29970 [Dyella mobilis]